MVESNVSFFCFPKVGEPQPKGITHGSKTYAELSACVFDPRENFYLWGFWNELHTARFARSVVKIHYGPHPRHGEEAEVFLSYKCGEETFYLISLFDNSRVLIPAWMTDEHACRCCVVCDAPVCSLATLRQLRQVLDALAT